MNFFGWDLGFVLPIHYIEMFLANGILFETEYNPSIQKNKITAEAISIRCNELLDEMIKQRDCFKNKGYSGNQVASMIVYTARKEVLNLSRARHIWPKELQLISRQTCKEVKKLASLYKKQCQRTEPFAASEICCENQNQQQQSFAKNYSEIIDLTKKKDATLMSPKASTKKDKCSSEKRTAEKIPIASINIP